MNYEIYKSMDYKDRKKFGDKYHAVKAMARKRGIDWQFTIETWLNWWGDDWHLRGQGAGRLSCVRKDLDGPFSPDNCDKREHREYTSKIDHTRRVEHSVGMRKAQKRGLPRHQYHCKPVMTPAGRFDTTIAACRHYGVYRQILVRWMREKPTEFYYVSKY